MGRANCMMNEVIELNESELVSKEKITEFILKVEEKMKSGIQIEIPIEHYFSKSVYAREMRVPKGVMLVGKFHKFENLNILSQGEVTVISIDGVKKVKAPHTFVASPGSKRLFYMHEDTVWTTILGTEEKDPEVIESQFIAKSFDELLEFNKSQETIQKLEEKCHL